MIVYRNCYLYRCGNDIIISTSKNPNSSKKINESRLSYVYGHSQNLKAVKDEGGNYFYLADDCQEIQ